MQLTVKNGEAKLTATKTELRALRGGIEVLAAFARIEHEDKTAADCLACAKQIERRLNGVQERDEA
jgi:hypothetical protein